VVRLLEKVEEAGRRVSVVELVHDGSRRYYDGGVLYTGVDAAGNNPRDYVDAMAMALPRSGEVLVLGTAGGALATLLHRSGACVTAVDVWPQAFSLARRWFHLPPAVTCIEADAAAFLRVTPTLWPAVAVDVFDGLTIPPSMLDPEAGASLARILSPGGVIVWNVAAGLNGLDTRRVLRMLRQAGLAARAKSVRGDHRLANTLVIAQKPDWRRAA
jgi:spermidine synthase